MIELTLAMGLDLLIGDPVYAFHPVRLMGNVIQWGEDFLRARIQNVKQAGAILAFALPVLVFLAVAFVIALVGQVHWSLAWALNLYGIYAALSIQDLRKESIQVYQDLEAGDLPKARTDLARIVGRDTGALDQKEIIRAASETVAESTVDGIIAPLFFAAIGGAPLALAYKAVNTLDSMIGHLNERYRDFGYWAAKQDEFWNWVPARLSYFLISAAALFTGGNFKDALAVGWRDGMSVSNGNSALPEAAFAGALGVRFGGPSTYQGRPVEKPLLGFSKKTLEPKDILKSNRLMLVTSVVSLLAAILLKCAGGF